MHVPEVDRTKLDEFLLLELKREAIYARALRARAEVAKAVERGKATEKEGNNANLRTGRLWMTTRRQILMLRDCVARPS